MKKQKQQRFSQTKTKQYDFNSMILNGRPPSTDKQLLTQQQYSSKLREIKALKKFQELFKKQYLRQQKSYQRQGQENLQLKRQSPHQLCNRLRGMFFLRRRAQFQSKFNKQTEEDESEQQQLTETTVQGLTFYPLKPHPQPASQPKAEQKSLISSTSPPKPLNFILPNSHKLLHKTLIPHRPHTQLESTFSQLYSHKIFNSQTFYSLVLKANKVKLTNFRPANFVYFSVYVEEGNNSQMIKSAVRKRAGWKVVQIPAVANMLWTQLYRRGMDARLRKGRQFERSTQDSLQLAPQNFTNISTIPQLHPPRRKSNPQKSPQHNPNLLPISQYQAQIHKIYPNNEPIQRSSFHTLPAALYFYNHIPNNHYISDKKNLLRNMIALYDKKKKNIFDVVPFSIDVCQSVDLEKIRMLLVDGEDADGAWIVKPGENSNRGRGIVVCKNLQAAIQEINARFSKPGPTNVDQPPQQSNIPESQAQSPQKIQRQTLILQKYLSPLLYNKRKFDIRMYLLVTITNRKMRGYVYNQGYIRTSSKPFSMATFDKFVHLTNDAIQTRSSDYGKYEEGNKISWKKFQKWMEDQGHIGFWGAFQSRYKQICKQVLESVKDPFLKKHSKYCSEHLISLSKKLPVFELKKSVSINQQQVQGESNKIYFEVFGLDFLIDSALKTWLIQVNTNPALTTDCSRVVNSLIPKMIDNAFAIAIQPYLRNASTRQYDTVKFQNNFEAIYDDQWVQ